ncbi:MAG: nucleoside-triphosphatase [Candidatus Heimdallarchaeota archaeon]
MVNQQQRRIILTGNPRIGKTTIIKRIISTANDLSLAIAGIMTPEILDEGNRIGFQIVDLISGKKEILASLETKNNWDNKWKVGKYRVHPKAMEKIAIPALRNAFENTTVDILVIDEIGKMELLSADFAALAIEAFVNEKYGFSVLATLGRGIPRGFRINLDENFIENIRVEVSNRDSIAMDLQKWILRLA